MEKTIIVLFQNQNPSAVFFYIVYCLMFIFLGAAAIYYGYYWFFKNIKDSWAEEEKENKLLSSQGFTEAYIKQNAEELLCSVAQNIEIKIEEYQRLEQEKFDIAQHNILESLKNQFIAIKKQMARPECIGYAQYLFKKLLIINIKLSLEI